MSLTGRDWLAGLLQSLAGGMQMGAQAGMQQREQDALAKYRDAQLGLGQQKVDIAELLADARIGKIAEDAAFRRENAPLERGLKYDLALLSGRPRTMENLGVDYATGAYPGVAHPDLESDDVGRVLWNLFTGRKEADINLADARTAGANAQASNTTGKQQNQNYWKAKAAYDKQIQTETDRLIQEFDAAVSQGGLDIKKFGKADVLSNIRTGQWPEEWSTAGYPGWGALRGQGVLAVFRQKLADLESDERREQYINQYLTEADQVQSTGRVQGEPPASPNVSPVEKPVITPKQKAVSGAPVEKKAEPLPDVTKMTDEELRAIIGGG